MIRLLLRLFLFSLAFGFQIAGVFREFLQLCAVLLTLGFQVVGVF